MPLFLKSNLCFIHIPRSGGSYIESLFEENGDKGILLSPHQLINGTSPQHQCLDNLTWLNMIPENFVIFTVIRPDVDRFISEYNWLLKRKVLTTETSFSQFLDDFLNVENCEKYDNHNMPNSWFLKDTSSHWNCIMKIPYEELYNNQDGGVEKIIALLNKELCIDFEVPKEEVYKNDSKSKVRLDPSQVSEDDRKRIIEYCKSIE